VGINCNQFYFFVFIKSKQIVIPATAGIYPSCQGKQSPNSHSFGFSRPINWLQKLLGNKLKNFHAESI